MNIKVDNIDERVENEKFFEDYTFDELKELSKFIKDNPQDKVYNLFKPYAEFLRLYYFHVNKVDISLENCILIVEMSFIDELILKLNSENIIKLPCDIGDVIYSYRYNCEKQKFEIIQKNIKDIHYKALENKILVSDDEVFKELGKEVFLTEDELTTSLINLLKE